MDENMIYDRVVEHDEWMVEDGFMKRQTVERQFVDGNADHGPYNRVYHCTYIDGELVKEEIITEPLEYSFEYYMDKMLVKQRPFTVRDKSSKDTVYFPPESDFIEKDEMEL